MYCTTYYFLSGDQGKESRVQTQVCKGLLVQHQVWRGRSPFTNLVLLL